MPNWCTNTLIVEGSVPYVRAFLAAIQTDEPQEFSMLANLYPIPDSEERNWYEWSIANWGTKWPETPTGLYLADLDRGEITLHFDTAWSPPIEGLVTISKHFPTLRLILTYSEPGMAVAGAAIVKAGAVTEREVAWPTPDLDEDDYDSYDPYDELEALLDDAVEALL